jgi:hypothetical protein
MHDRFSIVRDGQLREARRFLREGDDGRTYQTVFYLGSARSDPTGYAQQTSEDPAMNAVADQMLSALVDEATKAQHGARSANNGRV